jgi:hypothetical protein
MDTFPFVYDSKIVSTFSDHGQAFQRIMAQLPQQLCRTPESVAQG